ncbi:transcription factor bHLH18-like [Senna tora]|uniref:Transcription factor bHLH18-like n=1 Tax=Senna tora TaxID=362788 RepID=A0A834TUL2_9FABA|nr:transcription factor bHLH18-like [Senna tora]
MLLYVSLCSVTRDLEAKLKKIHIKMMEISSNNYELPAELVGMEDSCLFEEYPIDSFGYGVDQLQSFSGSGDSCYSSYNDYAFNSKSFPVESPESVAPPPPPSRPAKQLKTTHHNHTWTQPTTTTLPPHKPNSSSSASHIISFDNSNSNSNSSSLPNSHHFYSLDSTPTLKPKTENLSPDNLDFSAFLSQPPYPYPYDDHKLVHKAPIPNKPPSTIPRNPIQAQDHVMAERKRREKLSQRFIALSAILPGLKKMDKASVLGDAIKYVKQLQDRVKSLEEQVAHKSVESAVFVNRSIVFAEDDASSSDENCESRSLGLEQPLPEIEARVSGKEVLIRIHCEKHNGYGSSSSLNAASKIALVILNHVISAKLDDRNDLIWHHQVSA